jgi:hypothetical protein
MTDLVHTGASARNRESAPSLDGLIAENAKALSAQLHTLRARLFPPSAQSNFVLLRVPRPLDLLVLPMGTYGSSPSLETGLTLSVDPVGDACTRYQMFTSFVDTLLVPSLHICPREMAEIICR